MDRLTPCRSAKSIKLLSAERAVTSLTKPSGVPTEQSFPAEYWSFPILRNKQAIGSVVTFFDITERIRIQENLHRNEEQFRQLAENIDEVFLVYTTDPVRMSYLSPAYERIWGRPRQDVYDRPLAWIEAIHPEDLERARANYAEAMRGNPTDHEYRIERPDGSIRWIRIRAFPLFDERGNFYRLVGLAEDTTRWKTVQAEMEKAIALAEHANRAKASSWQT